jgi:hypothetical protein
MICKSQAKPMPNFDQSKSQYEELERLHTRWCVVDADHDAITQEIHESVLSVETRTHWAPAGSGDSEPGEFRIVLCTGGPHVELTGQLDRLNEPCDTEMYECNWGTPRAPYTEANQEILDWFAGHFYFGA